MADLYPESDLRRFHNMTWEQWRDALEAEHARRRGEVEGFDGYGENVMEATGEDCWRDGYFADGYSPVEALDEDMTYWE